MDDLIKAVRAHAVANYESDGWDFVVEAWEDEDIAELLDSNMNEAEAIAKVGGVASLLDDRRKDVQAEIF